MDRVFIIAEAGVNHNGEIQIAKELVDKAVDAGVDAVKFQTFCTEQLICRDARKADYQLKRTEKAESQYDMLKKLELSESMHKELIAYCNMQSILFLSTPFDLESIDKLSHYGMPLFKIPSGEITNYPYLKKVGSLEKDVILSTGMSTLNEVKEAMNILSTSGAKSISVLHCTTEYPAPIEDVNLRAILTLKKQLGIQVGYSDHTEGIEVAIAAVAIGATIIEKHFTLNKNMKGPDHRASLEPNELEEMVKAIRKIEKAMGTGEKIPSNSENNNKSVARKSIVANQNIKKGEFLTEENITTKRPGTGISPMKWNEIIGSIAVKDFCMDEFIVQ